MVGYPVPTFLPDGLVCIRVPSGLEWALCSPLLPLGQAGLSWSFPTSTFIPISFFQPSSAFSSLLPSVFLLSLSLQHPSHNASLPFLLLPPSKLTEPSSVLQSWVLNKVTEHD